MTSIQDRMDHMEDKIDALISSVEALRVEVAETREIVEAWKASKTLLRWTKWIAGFIAAVAGAYFIIRDGLFPR